MSTPWARARSITTGTRAASPWSTIESGRRRPLRPSDHRRGAGDGDARRSTDVVWDFDTIYNLARSGLRRGRRPRRHTRGRDPRARHPGRGAGRRSFPSSVCCRDDFPEPFLKVFDLRDGRRRLSPRASRFRFSRSSARWACPPTSPGRCQPVPSAQGRRQRRLPPLIAGSTLWLPVWCDGRALLVRGSPRGAGRRRGLRQRDRVRDARRRSASASASARSAVPRSTCRTRSEAPGPYHGTMGIDADLMEGARTAVRNMIALARRRAWIEPRGRLHPLQPRRRSSDPRDRRRRRLERRHDHAPRRLRPGRGATHERRRSAKLASPGTGTRRGTGWSATLDGGSPRPPWSSATAAPAPLTTTPSRSRS